MVVRGYWLIVAAMLLVASVGQGAEKLTSFDFEDGTLQGWKVVSGSAGTLPTGPANARADQNFGQQGKYFIGLYENSACDEATIVLQSPTFTVASDHICLLVGGGNHEKECYIALYRASDNSEVARETGRDAEVMSPRYWDVRSLKGQQVYLKIVDSHKGGWGHLNVDDIHEMTPAEAKQRSAEIAAKAGRYDRWLASVKAPAKRIVYRGNALKDIAMPIGGIGSGHVSICGDGAVRQWNIFNKCNEGCMVPDSFFAVWAKLKYRDAVAKVLQQTPIAGLPAMKSVEFVGEYPIAELKFADRELPVQVSMRVFSPHIPMNSKDSAIPAAVFEITLRNPGSEAVDVSVLSTLQNAAGYDGVSKIDGVFNRCCGGNTNEGFSASGLRGALLSNPTLKADARQFGTMAISTRGRNAEVTAQWDDLGALWRAFAETGSVGRVGKSGPSPAGRTWNSAVTVPVTLEPGQQVTIPFVWSWHFPNLYVWWDGREGQPKIGRMYSNWFTDAAKAAEYVSANYGRLRSDTLKFRDTFYKTTLPYWMLDRISAQDSTLVSTVCMWLEDGSFVGFEGAGCCPMNCAHVWNYEQQIAHLFPDLERNMRRIDLEVQQQPNGTVFHRTRLPLSLPRESGAFVDGQLGTILKCYREYRQSADRQWLHKMWPRIKLAMQFVLNDWDPNQDGVLVNAQWNTYDAAMYGPNTFIGTLYLGALRASEEMAKIEGDAEFAKQVRGVFELGSKRLDSVLWNGEFYVQIESPPADDTVGANTWLLEDWPGMSTDPNVNRPYGKGCHADQFLGQWWATQLDLGYLLPKDRIDKGLHSIMKYNWVKDFSQVRQWPRQFAGDGDPGLYICTWPNGGKPESETLYSFEVWTGIEYEVAGLLIQEGKVDEALKIVKAASDRYNGAARRPIRRNPWAEIECSNHYARAMASWAMLTAAQGYSYCGPDMAIGFNPVINAENHVSFFTGAEGWGLFTQKRGANRQENSLAVEYGKLDVKTFTVHLAKPMPSVRVKLDKRFGEFTTKVTGDAVTIEFTKMVRLEAGEKMVVGLGW